MNDTSAPQTVTIPEGGSGPRDARGPWYRAAVGSSVASGALLLVACALLFVNRVSREPYNPLDTQHFKMLKAQLSASPRDEALKAQIRSLDLELREGHFYRLDFSSRGAWLLLGSIVIFVLSLKWVYACRRPLPMPRPEGEERFRDPAHRSMATVAALGSLFAVAALVLSFTDAGSLEVAASKDGAAGAGAGVAPAATPVAPPSPEEIAKEWPRFRGPHGAGTAASEAPTSFNVATGEGILWKSPIPLPGFNSPVVWRDRVFLTGADEAKREVYCLDAGSGKLLWTVPVGRGGGEPPELLESTGFAAPTAAVDGRRVFAVFATGDVAGIDFQGKKLWERSFGPLDNHYGHGSSLDTYRDLVYVLLDQGMQDDGKSILLALDALSGKTVWEAKRPVGGSWATPLVAATPQGDQLITSSNPYVISNDPLSGVERWRADVMGGDVAPSPLYAGGLVLAVTIDTELVAIRPDGKGDVTETHVAWRAEDGLPDICSPLATSDRVYLLSTSGKLTCYPLSTGTVASEENEVAWEEKLKLQFHASPSLVGGRIVLLAKKGIWIVIEDGPAYKEILRCELGEEANASPAFAGGRTYIRGATNLYCLGKP